MQPAKPSYDRFEVDRVAGSGAMGVVYLAHDSLTGEKVALKVLRGSDDVDARRFAREARALAELHHPGIVRYVAHGESKDGDRWLAMEWLEGETLSDRLQRHGLTIAESVAVVLHASEAVAALHHRGMLHRDLKPSNIFLVRGEVDRVKVLDFGLARFGVRSADASTTGMLVGTPNYMSPEQAQGSRSIDARADVFALGCVLFRCLTGRAPFHAPDATRVLTKLLFEDAPLLSSLLPNAPKNLEALMARILAKSPDRRPADAERLATELRSLGGLEGEARPAPSVEGRVPALTGTEQRLFALLAAGETYVAPVGDPTHAERRSSDHTPAALLRTTLTVSGGRVELHTDTALVATFTAHGTASDLAVQVSRCALAVRAIWPDVPISVSMGWARGNTGWKESEVSTRAAELIARGRDDEGQARIVVDRMVANLLDARFDVGAEEPRVLRGERELAGPVRTLLGKPSPCVGRERELALLQGTYDEVVSEPRARVAIVTAPAGAGKSRLRHELFRRLRERGDAAEVWNARGDPMSAGSPFGLLAPAVRKVAGILDGEPEQVRQQKLRARVGRHVREEDRVRITDFVGELAGVGMPDVDSVLLRSARENPLTMGDQIARAFEDWLAAECSVRPIILAIDDMHWGDWPSARLVDGALRNLADKPLFVLALGRPEIDDVLPGLFRDRDALTLRLGPIGRKAAEALAREMLGSDAKSETISRVVDLAAGNVFYLEELIRAVAEGRGDALPDTVVAMVQARAMALEPEARRVLRAASVFGEAFWRGGLLALLGGARRGDMLDDITDELVSLELIGERLESRFPGEREYVFRHSLVRDGAYALLTDEDKALGHRLAGEWLQSSGESAARVLAEHLERGGEPATAATWWARAAEDALEGNDFAGALESVHRGITCGAEGEAKGRLLLLEARARRWRAEQAEAERAALGAMELLARASREWLDAVGEAAPASCRLGHAAELERLAAELESVPDLAKQTVGFAAAAGTLGVQLMWMGHREEAKRLLALIDAMESNELLVLGWRHRLRGFIAQFEGDNATYLRGSELAALAFERAGEQRLASGLQISVGFALATMGRYEEAEERLRTALTAAERIGLPTTITLAKHNLGLVVARQGRTQEGLRYESEAVAECMAQGDRRIESGARAYLSEIMMDAGDLDGAFAEASRSYDVSSDPGRAFALGLMAEARRKQGRLEEALERSEAGMALLERLGGIEEGSVHLRLVRAETLHEAGRLSEARQVLAAALAEIDLRAQKLPDDEARKAFRERVPEHRDAALRAKEWGTG